jgi:hypothetical protein
VGSRLDAGQAVRKSAIPQLNTVLWTPNGVGSKLDADSHQGLLDGIPNANLHRGVFAPVSPRGPPARRRSTLRATA